MICRCGKKMGYVSEVDNFPYFYCDDCDETIYSVDLPKNHPERLKHQEDL